MTSKRLLIKVSHKPSAPLSASARLGISGPEFTLTPLFEVPTAARTGFAVDDDLNREHRWYLAEPHGQLAFDELSGVNDWDVAHRFVAEGFGLDQARLLAVEPDFEQVWPITPPPNTCPFRKSYPDVLVMQPCQDGNSDNGTRPSDCSTQGCIFL